MGGQSSVSLAALALLKKSKPVSSLANSGLHHTGLWKCVTPQLKEISAALRQKSCWWSPGWKRLWPSPIHQTTVSLIAYTWRKFNVLVLIPRAMIKEVTENPLVTSTGLSRVSKRQSSWVMMIVCTHSHSLFFLLLQTMWLMKVQLWNIANNYIFAS